jgi:Amt family ammonium transporter
MSSLCRYAQRAVCAALILCSWSLTAMAQAPAPAAAAAPKIDSGDTAWMLTSTALVLMMTIPGLALFYGGMMRKMMEPAAKSQQAKIDLAASVIGEDRGRHATERQQHQRSRQ